MKTASAFVVAPVLSVPRSLSATIRLALTVGIFAVLTVGPLEAQQGDEGSIQQDITFFYRQPEIGRAVDLVRRFNASSFANNAGAQGAMAGFMAALVRRHPREAERFAIDELKPELSFTVAIGVRLGGRADAADVISVRDRWPPERAEALRRWPSSLDEVRITAPVHLDIFWGASSATGDGTYARRIWSTYAEVANSSRVNADDVVEIVQVRHRRSQANVRELLQKYDSTLQPRVLLAATALWSLESNARRHTFVREAIDALISAGPGEPAAIGFAKARQP